MAAELQLQDCSPVGVRYRGCCPRYGRSASFGLVGLPPETEVDAIRGVAVLMPERIAANGSESANQMALFAWAAQQCGHIPELAAMYAIPNGGARSAVTGARLKAEGVRAGVPDICLPVARCGHNALYIELKTATGKLSEVQLAFGDRLRIWGNRVVICRGWESARDEIVDYLEVECR